MIAGKPFDPGTFTSRRPTPEVFTHLRKWVTPVSQSVMITNITELTNIDQQLEQVSRFYISSIISRVIAQLTAQYNDGFRTLVCTEDGELKVQVSDRPPTVLQKAITIAAAASTELIAAVTGKKICVDNIAFTVFGEVNITLQSAANALSGAMDFGAADEPRGMVQHFGNFPLKTVAGEAFNILASTDVQISGYVTYHTE